MSVELAVLSEDPAVYGWTIIVSVKMAAQVQGPENSVGYEPGSQAMQVFEMLLRTHGNAKSIDN